MRYDLVIVNKDDKRKRTRAGVAFEGKYGFNLVLNPGVVLTAELGETCWLNLFPAKEDGGSSGGGGGGRRRDPDTQPKQPATDEPDADDIPF